MKKNCQVSFVSQRLEKSFEKLEEGCDLKKHLIRALNDICENAFVGVRIPKKLIPKEYFNLGVTNLWKYDLPDGWRVIYSVTSPSKVEIVSVILEWFNHKAYERRFNYLL